MSRLMSTSVRKGQELQRRMPAPGVRTVDLQRRRAPQPVIAFPNSCAGAGGIQQPDGLCDFDWTRFCHLASAPFALIMRSPTTKP